MYIGSELGSACSLAKGGQRSLDYKLTLMELTRGGMLPDALQGWGGKKEQKGGISYEEEWQVHTHLMKHS